MFTVLAPGTRTLVQDLGRPGYEHLGVPSAGAAVPHLLTLANHLIGNTPTTAALEVTLTGPTLRFHEAATVAYAGPDADLKLNQTRLRTHHPIHLKAGDILTVGALRHGVFGYLAVRGGICVPEVLGSRSTCTLSGIGPEPLRAGAVVPTEVLRAASTRSRALARLDRSHNREPIRFVRGPHADTFAAGVYDRFQRDTWVVSPDSSRVGIRLCGPQLMTQQASLPSLGMVTGAVQIPPSGQPIVLGPDHGTVGGYPVIGVIVPTDLGRLMQHRPGEQTTFAEVSLHEAYCDPRPIQIAAVVDLDALAP